MRPAELHAAFGLVLGMGISLAAALSSSDAVISLPISLSNRIESFCAVISAA